MKDSGIPWIGEIPEGWKVARLKNVCTSNRESLSEKTDKDFEFDYVDIGSVTFEKGIFNSERITFGNAPTRARKRAQLGDIIISTVRTYLRAIDSIDSIEKASYIYSTGFAVLTPFKLINSKFLSYIAKSECFTEQVTAFSKGINYPSINTTDLLTLGVVIPPLAEQEAIAEFLDRKCGEVDEMVSLQEQVIEELKAYKQSVITEAVTKGLNPSAPMKPSNIDWIGQIPVEWDVVKLSLMTSKIGSGKTPTGGATIYTESGIMFLRSQNVYNEVLKLDDVAFIPPSIDDTMANTRVKDGDVLLNITGGSIGRCYCINDKNIRANVNQHVCIIRPIIEKLYGKYLQYVINSNVIQTQIRLCQTGSNREELNFEHISNFKIPFMPVSMQREIADFLDRKCADIDALIALKQQKIEDLKQYKKSLIYEYVTGKKQHP